VTAADIADLECRGLQAFSGLITKPIGEWFAVVGPSSARRANSIYPIGDPGRALDSALEVASDFLRSHGKPVLVKVAAAPGKSHDIEPLLVSSAFRPEAPTEVHIMPLLRRDPPLTDKVFVEEVLPGAGGPAARAIASHPGGFGRGRAVVMDEWIGIFDLETESGVQRKGLGRTVLGSLLAWGAGLGAERAFLQVEAANVPARALYESAGFELAYTYAYWREPARSKGA
jgi:GNAT superfamily N-acetyltransferase